MEADGGSQVFFYLNPATGNFAGDTRYQGRRRMRILQALDNEADSVKLPIPAGEKMKKKILHPISESKKFFLHFRSAGFRFKKALAGAGGGGRRRAIQSMDLTDMARKEVSSSRGRAGARSGPMLFNAAGSGGRGMCWWRAAEEGEGGKAVRSGGMCPGSAGPCPPAGWWQETRTSGRRQTKRRPALLSCPARCR